MKAMAGGLFNKKTVSDAPQFGVLAQYCSAKNARHIGDRLKNWNFKPPVLLMMGSLQK